MARGLGGAAGKVSLDAAMAALAAASAGFVTFAMPDAVFADLIGMSGLPALIPAAEPPLGPTARLAAVAAVAVGAFLLVSLLLRALGQQPPKAETASIAPAAPKPAEAPAATGGRRRSFLPEPEPEAPRIRRADAHPDAPSRRPLFAGTDLGEPLDDIDLSEETDWLDSPIGEASQWPAPLPGFLNDAPAEEEWADEPAGGMDEGAEDMPAAEQPDFEVPAYQPPAYQPEAYQAPVFEAAEPIYDDPIDEGGELPEEPRDEPVSEPLEAEFYAPIADAPPPPPAEESEASIAELMQRLERGLSRLEQGDDGPGQSAPPADQAQQSQSSSQPQAPIDDRLRNALDDLQKMASRSAQG